jgi:outer membrane protein assembly factor BamB
MIPASLVAALTVLTGTASATNAGIPFGSTLEMPSERYEGDFAAAPGFHWRVKLPGPRLNSATHAERGRPLVVDDRILVGSAAASGVAMMSRVDGTLLRMFESPQSVESQPAVAGDRIVFSDTGGTTSCYRLDGTLEWQHKGTAPVLVRPLIHEGSVIVANVDDLAVALQLDDGALLWRYKARRDLTRQAELALYAAPAPTVLGESVLIGLSDGRLVAVDLDSGEEQWAKPVGEGRYPDLVAETVVRDTDLYASGYYLPLVAVDAATRNVRWRLDIGGAAPVELAEDGTVLYHPGSDGKLRAVGTFTGAERWAWDSKSTGAISQPVLTDAGVLVASSEGGVYLIDPENGRELWRFTAPYVLQGVSTAPTVDGRQMLFVSNGGYLYSMLAPEPAAPKQRAWP